MLSNLNSALSVEQAHARRLLEMTLLFISRMFIFCPTLSCKEDLYSVKEIAIKLTLFSGYLRLVPELGRVLYKLDVQPRLRTPV